MLYARALRSSWEGPMYRGSIYRGYIYTHTTTTVEFVRPRLHAPRRCTRPEKEENSRPEPKWQINLFEFSHTCMYIVSAEQPWKVKRPLGENAVLFFDGP
jgi:hypothetical protein